MKNVSLSIDGQKISAPAGTSVLQAALDNDIYIPNLCHLPGKPEPSASCRLCWVEIAGQDRPVTSCTTIVAEGMVVSTRADAALGLARAGFELLMASHDLDCAHCPANGACELQKIAKHIGARLKPKRLRVLLPELPVDDSNPLFTFNPNWCVLCGRCVWTCRQHRETAVLGFAHRGFGRRVTTFGDEPIGKNRCLKCEGCIEVCPTGALSFKKK